MQIYGLKHLPYGECCVLSPVLTTFLNLMVGVISLLHCLRLNNGSLFSWFSWLGCSIELSFSTFA
jgi:hypothetical protein